MHCEDGISVCRMGMGSWVSRAQADALIRVLCWNKTSARLRVGEQDWVGQFANC